MGRLTIDLTDQQHRDLKAVAALQGKTIKQFAVERLLPVESGGALSDEDQAWEEFKAFIKARIESGLAGDVSKRSIRQIADDALLRHKAA